MYKNIDDKLKPKKIGLQNSFYSELDAFKVRIKKRAQEKIAEALEEERQERLGPGGLDPVDVFESLPER